MKPYNIDMNGEFNKSFNSMRFEINESGIAHLDTSWTSNINGKRDEIIYPHFTFYYIIDGNGFVEVEGGTIELKSGHMYIIPPFCGVKYYCCDKMTQLYILVQIDFESTFLISPNLIGQSEVGSDYINSMKKAYERCLLKDVLFIKQHLISDMLRCYENTSYFKSKINMLSEDMRSIIKYIEENLSVQLRAADIGKNIGLNPNTLRIKFKKEMGESLGTFIDRMIFAEAKRMLITQNDNIAQISDRLGFSDQFNFSHKFKKKFGESPTSFRKHASVIKDENDQS